MLNKNLNSLIAAALFLPTLALAEPNLGFATNSGKPSAEQIADINERLAVLTAQLSELEMRAKIAAKQAELEKSTNPTSPSIYQETFVPSVDFIDAVDGKYKASLFVQGGNTQSVRVGDKVGLWTVKQIKMDSVTVQKGKEIVHLGFGSFSTNPDPLQAQNSVNGQFPQIPR